MKTIKKISWLGLFVALSGFLIFAISHPKSKNRAGLDYFPEKIDFCTEQTPLQINDVKERFDKELIINKNYHSSTILILKRANKIFPIIEPILAKNKVPNDFKYLAVIESSLNPEAVSSSGAKGIWQFLGATAQSKGIEVSETVDERYHIEKATQAACEYLVEAKEKLGSWTLAAAAYNAGISGISKRLEHQKVTNYYDLLLLDETSRYVFRILAIKEIMNNPSLFGYDIPSSDLYKNLPTRTVPIDSTINDLSSFAIQQGVNYKILKLHNPWLRDKKLDNKLGKKYNIEIPVEGY